jgi:hypothetical protein
VLFSQQSLIPDDAYAESLAASKLVSDQDYGAVFTRRWVVELILDLAGYTPERDLAAMRTIEPACGDGAFLGPIVDRLIESCRIHKRDIGDAAHVLRACDLQPTHVETSRELVRELLAAHDVSQVVAAELAGSWITHDDFLLSQHEIGTADFVLGNPPYIRLEAVPTSLSDAYRRACQTMAGRSDVFVGFFEVGLKALRVDGALGFICADRWMRNQYGQKLRQLVAAHFSVDATIEMHDVDAFDADVSAYPSITILRRAKQGSAVIATASSSFGPASAARVRAWNDNGSEPALADADFDAARLPTWFDGNTSWPAGSPERLALVARLEHDFPPLEDAGTHTRVGIGVATGIDQVFVVKDASIVEEDRALPLAMARDTLSGDLRWSGHYLVDPWEGDTGSLVKLSQYPRLAAYLESHEDLVRRRNVAGRRPDQWYRTIDRVDHVLTGRAKLLFPDIKAAIHPVLDDGKLYPHHNLYWVASDGWPIEVLGGLLLSRVAQMFIEAYAVKMRGGFLRFQAQYLRRIRVPYLGSMKADVGASLARAFQDRDVELATAAAAEAYQIREIPR